MPNPFGILQTETKRDRSEDFVPGAERVRLFLIVHWRGVLIFLVPLACLPIIMPPPAEPYQWVGYTLVVMAIFWMTECIPLPVTSFLPLFVFPMTDVMDTATTAQCYLNDTVFMFLGSLFLAAAVEQSGLHKRLALGAIRNIGYSHFKLLFAMCFVTMFVSMWITNTAAASMMVPINFALLKVFEEQKLLRIFETNRETGEQKASSFTVCYFCAATFAATVGGIGTLVGTGTNLVFKGLLEKNFPAAPEYLTFPSYSAFAIPYMVVLQLCVYMCMILVYFGYGRPQSAAGKMSQLSENAKKAAKRQVETDSAKLGRITFWEIMVTILFVSCMLMFFCRSPNVFTGWGDAIANYFEVEKKFIKDSACAMCFCFLMFLLPSKMSILKNFTVKHYEELPKTRQKSVIDFPLMDATMPYSFAFLLGGGFALSTAASDKYSNLNGKIGDALSSLSSLPNSLVILIIIILTVFITNFASNVAVCNVITPIAMTLASKIKQNPLLYTLASGVSASFCFCLPVGTPGNLVVQSAAKISTGQMIVAGALPTLITILISWFFLMFYAPLVWSDIKTFPDWAGGGNKTKPITPGTNDNKPGNDTR